jgi:hypothetical protein
MFQRILIKLGDLKLGVTLRRGYMADPLIKPNRISLFSQVPGKFFFHQKCLFPGHWLQIEMIIKTGTQIRSIFLNDISR